MRVEIEIDGDERCETCGERWKFATVRYDETRRVSLNDGEHEWVSRTASEFAPVRALLAKTQEELAQARGSLTHAETAAEDARAALTKATAELKELRAVQDAVTEPEPS